MKNDVLQGFPFDAQFGTKKSISSFARTVEHPAAPFNARTSSSLRYVPIALAPAKECEAYDLPSPLVLSALLTQMKKKLCSPF
jgi:hypothetical protein